MLIMQHIKLLIIDDEIVDRIYYKRILKEGLHFSYETLEAANAKEAIDILKNNSIDCVLLDYQLPDMNGVELLKIIKKTSEKFMPIIMLTGQGNENIAVNAMKEGVTDYINKRHIEPILLVKAITSAIRNSQLKKIIYQQKKQLKYYAYYDELTGFMNRHAFEAMLNRSLSDAKQLNGSLAVLLIDIDNFVIINDSFGYLAGDEILIEMSKRLTNLLPKETIISRFAGNEFAILLTGSITDEEVAATAKNIIDKLNQSYPLSIDTVYITVSVGIACYPHDHLQPELLKCANIALTRVKAGAQGTFQFYSEEMDKVYQKNLAIEKSLRDAIHNKKEFSIVFQPIFELNTKKIFGMEVGVHWQQPQAGLMLPDQLMSIAEKSGLAGSIAAFALDTMNEYFSDSQAFSKKQRLHWVIDIPFLPRHLIHPLIAEGLRKLLATIKLKIEHVELEFTESILMEQARNQFPLEKIEGFSIQLAMSHLKIEYSSLSRLIQLPVTSLKINHFFVQSLDDGAYHPLIIQSMIQSIICLGNNLKLNVIAEGVETETQYRFLKDHGCNYATGNYFCKPLHAKEIDNFLQLKMEMINGINNVTK